MNDKTFGYIILASLLSIALLVFGYAAWVLVFPQETRIIAFNRVSNLRVDDPIKIRGVTVATIKSMTRNEKNSLITIKTFKPLPIYEGYTIYSADKGILGERLIILENGDSNNQVVSSDDTLTGIFHPGVSDVLGSAWKLKDLIVAFKENAGLLLSGSEEKPSFITTFSTIISEIDSFSTKLYNTAEFLDAELSGKINTLQSITASAQKVSHEIAGTIPEKIQTIEEQIEIITNFIEKLDTLIDTLTDILNKIKNNDLFQKDYISKMIVQLKELQELIDVIQDGTARLKVRLKLGF